MGQSMRAPVSQRPANYVLKAKFSPLPVVIKFYWNTITPNHVPVVSGCTHSSTAYLICCNRDCVSCET